MCRCFSKTDLTSDRLTPIRLLESGLSKELSWLRSNSLSSLSMRRNHRQRPSNSGTLWCPASCARLPRRGVRTLRERINSMLYERTDPDTMIAQELATMRDPFILDFLGLRDIWQEGDLEAAIIREMESFLLELGAGFSFLARKKRIQIDDENFHLDLLFYNRKLRRLVAVELKIGEFKAAYKGQMELYLRWFDKHERGPEEASPLGITLCTGKKSEQIELLELDKSGIHVAEYLTTQ